MSISRRLNYATFVDFTTYAAMLSSLVQWINACTYIVCCLGNAGEHNILVCATYVELIKLYVYCRPIYGESFLFF